MKLANFTQGGSALGGKNQTPTLFLNIVFFLFIILCLVRPSAVFAVDTTDTDGDGLSDYDEVNIYHTDSTKTDTDNDGYSDGEEVAHGYSPLVGDHKKLNKVDSDKDSLTDAQEIALGTDLMNADTDNDSFSDRAEVMSGFNPLKGDHDRSMPRRVEVDLTTQQLRYYLNNVLLGSIPVSTGIRGKYTPTGEFAIFKKVPVKRYVGPGYDLPNTKWNLEFLPSYYLHGAYWHNQFGIRPMSHGCVNIGYKDAEKLYSFLDVGDDVKIVGKTPVRVAVAKK